MKQLLQNWLTEQAEIRPEATAVTLKNHKMTYTELEEGSNRLARILKEFGCNQGDRVCMLVPKSPEAILCIFGILKADCIYVPIDPDGPVIRSVMMINKSDPKCILYSGSYVVKLSEILSKTKNDEVYTGCTDGLRSIFMPHNIYPDFSFGDMKNYPNKPLRYKNKPESPASILFTSGSTGAPKGVVNTHNNVIHFIDWARNYFKISPDDRISGHPPLHFDLSSMDIYSAVSSGAELHLVPPEINIFPKFLCDFIEKKRLTQWFSVPSVLNLIANFDVLEKNSFPELKRLLWCGEVLPASTLIYLMERLPNVNFTNLYGPTETTIASSYHTIKEPPSDASDKIPIGKACLGEKLHVLNGKMQPVSVGEKGDLYIEGVGVGLGYWEDPERTEKVFIENPFSDSPNSLIYKTGDVASFDDNGVFWFHGRNDSQIKSRGYRIELGEIENALHSLKLALECAVVAIPSDNFGGTDICCAFVPRMNKDIDSNMLREQLRRLLPDYMIPTKWKEYSILPKNKNGKIERKEIKDRFYRYEIKITHNG